MLFTAFINLNPNLFRDEVQRLSIWITSDQPTKFKADVSWECGTDSFNSEFWLGQGCIRGNSYFRFWFLSLNSLPNLEWRFAFVVVEWMRRAKTTLGFYATVEQEFVTELSLVDCVFWCMKIKWAWFQFHIIWNTKSTLVRSLREDSFSNSFSIQSINLNSIKHYFISFQRSLKMRCTKLNYKMWNNTTIIFCLTCPNRFSNVQVIQLK